MSRASSHALKHPPVTAPSEPAGAPFPELAVSIERETFPELLREPGRLFAFRSDAYWIDIGTPEKYMQVHRDIMARRYHAAPFASDRTGACVSPSARIEDGAIVEAPCFIDADVVVKSGARVGPDSVIGRHCHIEEHACVERSIVWANTRISQDAIVRNAILGRHCHIGRNALVENGAVLGDKSVITDYTRL